MEQQPIIPDDTTPNVGTLDYAAPQTPDAGEEEKQAQASAWSDGLTADLIPTDLPGVGEVVSTAAEVAGSAASAVGEGIGAVIGGIFEGLGGL